jgi:UDP-3-O-[3-hydroxymyristoyl] glucosamine N-acyltransferase
MPRLLDLARLVSGLMAGPNGLEDIVIDGAASVGRADCGQITLVTSESYLRRFENSPATAAVVPLGMVSSRKPCLQVENPEHSFSAIVALFRPQLQRKNSGISPQAMVSPSAIIDKEVCIHPGAVIMDGVRIQSGTTVFPNVTIMENCQIGKDVKIFPGAVLYENTEVGDRCIIHANAVLGAYGFGYTTVGGTHRLGPQLGNVSLASDVEIGANSTVDRGTYDSTEIGTGSKLDNLVMIGHNCRIGANNLLCSQVGIAGSCETGEHVVMGGQVGLADHLKIGNRVAIGAQSGVMHNLEDNVNAFGSPARPMREEMQILACKTKLPEMRHALRDLERKIESLQNQIDSPDKPREIQSLSGSLPTDHRAVA